MNSSLRLFPSALSAARAFSSKVSHTPPKKIHGIPGRYAGAVYTAASKIGALDRVESELQAFDDLIQKNPKFAAFISNPTISRTDKAAKVGTLIEEPKFSHVSRNLFLTLAANGRINEASKVIGAFTEIMAAARGAVKVTIISAEVLQKKQLAAIQAGILNMVGAGKTVDIVTEVNEGILGGLQVMVGDRFLDLSVSSRVADLSKALESSAN